eukprot:6484869-Amphidinium_carterae.4
MSTMRGIVGVEPASSTRTQQGSEPRERFGDLSFHCLAISFLRHVVLLLAGVASNEWGGGDRGGYVRPLLG